MMMRIFCAAVRLSVDHLVAACCHFLVRYQGTALTEAIFAGQDAEEAALCFAIRGHLRHARKVHMKRRRMQELLAHARGLTLADVLQTHKGRAD